MKKLSTVFLFAAILSLSFFSCSNSRNASVKIPLSSVFTPQVVKSITSDIDFPLSESQEKIEYGVEIYVTGDASDTFKARDTFNSLIDRVYTISDLTEGNRITIRFVITRDNIPLYSGSKTLTLEAGDNAVEIELYRVKTESVISTDLMEDPVIKFSYILNGNNRSVLNNTDEGSSLIELDATALNGMLKFEIVKPYETEVSYEWKINGLPAGEDPLLEFNWLEAFEMNPVNKSNTVMLMVSNGQNVRSASFVFVIQ